ncbi:MAG: phosphoribosylglycinamide formyltransferase [Saprospiraceae bacterium]
MRTPSKVKTLALFASGTGSNVRCIHAHFSPDPDVEIGILVCNRPDAAVVSFARDQNIPVRLMTREDLHDPSRLIADLQAAKVDLVILAGFLWKIPGEMVAVFPDRILNIHPALLPRYGGKGMYGKHVHEAVIAAGETESGITIHLVNDHYDEGTILFQARCPVHPGDTPEQLAERIHQLEHQHYPNIIEHYLSSIS